MTKLYLDYWEDNSKKIKNFGDELNQYLIERLGDYEVERVDFKLIFKSRTQSIKVLSYYLSKKIISLKDFYKYIYINLTKKKIILFIGSIINHCRTDNYIIWGAGIMFKNDNFHDANIRAVRGKYTQKRICELGYKPPTVVGDPAILLPLCYSIKSHKKKFKIGIIPHFKHYNQILRSIKDENISIINLNKPIEDVIEHINSCELTISTSLHGIIVSHSYKIPSLWVKFSSVDQNIGGDNVKFKDYFSSVNIKEYSPFIININNSGLIDSIMQLFDNKDIYMPDYKKIIDIQRNLIRVAPIKIKKNIIIKINEQK